MPSYCFIYCVKPLRKKDFKSKATSQSTNCKEFLDAQLLFYLLCLKIENEDFKSKATSQSTNCKEFFDVLSIVLNH